MCRYTVLAALCVTASSAFAGELEALQGESIDLGAYHGVVYYTEAGDDFRVVTTIAEGEAGSPVRFGWTSPAKPSKSPGPAANSSWKAPSTLPNWYMPVNRFGSPRPNAMFCGRQTSLKRRDGEVRGLDLVGAPGDMQHFKVRQRLCASDKNARRCGTASTATAGGLRPESESRDVKEHDVS
ncbi:hypothetical protein ABIA16_000805 [Sinorhizobium fredii]